MNMVAVKDITTRRVMKASVLQMKKRFPMTLNSIKEILTFPE
jgi:hypothetical protein